MVSCSTSLWCIRRINVRVCRPPVLQKKEWRRVDWTIYTGKIRSFFVTTTADEDETFEGNPENSKRDAVDVAPSVPAPEDGAAEELATAEPARRWPVVQELDLTLDNPADRVLFQLGTLPTELRTTILQHGPCHPKGSFAITSENGNRRMFSEKHSMHFLGQWK